MMSRGFTILRRLLAEPTARNLDLEDLRTRSVHRQMLRRKAFLRRIYEEWYAEIASWMAPPALELGSGGGFLQHRVPGVLASDIVPGPGLDLVAESVRSFMPLRYLLSGGLSMRSLAPGWSFGIWTTFERMLTPWMRHLAMFALIVLRRTGCEEPDSHFRESASLN